MLADVQRRPWRDGLGLALVVFIMLLGGILAYHAGVHQHIGIGDGPDAGYDKPYLQGFNADPEMIAGGKIGFRWAFGDATIRLPGLGRSSYLFVMQLAAGRPQPTTSHWQLAGQSLVNVPIQQRPRRYTLLLPQGTDDLHLQMMTPSFHAGSDRRELALAVDWLDVQSVGAPIPALRELGGCALIIGLLYGLLRWWHLPVLPTVLLVSGVALGLAALLVWYRLALTIATSRWLLLIVAAYPLFWLVRWCLVHLAIRLVPRAVGQAHAIAALVVLAWLIRVLALLHPQAITSDAGFHAHNLANLAAGRVIFTEDLPARAGGGKAPYPPGGYITLLPAALLLPPDPLMAVGSALIDSLVIGGLWLLCALVGLTPPAALFAGGLYLFAAPALRSLSIGEMANVWAQALTVPFAVALLGWHNGRVGSVALVAWAAVALLGHFGVFLSLLAFGGIYAIMLVLARERFAPKLIGLLGLAALIAVLLYYLVWTGIILKRIPTGPADTAQLPIGPVRPTIAISIRLIWQQLRGLGDLRDIGLLPALLGLGGLGLLWRRERSLARLEAAWWLAGLLSLAPLLWSFQPLRWQLWLFGAAALCGGVALGTCWKRGLVGRGVSLTLLLLWAARVMPLWVIQIASFRH
ncbi:MAG: hypothetical protein H0X37_18135 [Herpetosiphonaceae bacterium]|nr:hypothetical protein [Herpetosiphonaceae bacterium]